MGEIYISSFSSWEHFDITMLKPMNDGGIYTCYGTGYYGDRFENSSELLI